MRLALTAFLLAVLAACSTATPGVAATRTPVPPAPAMPAASCAATARHLSEDPRITALVKEARAQQQAFGGQAIDTAGRLVQAGYQEAEFDRAAGDSVPTWRKVLRFWEALGPDALENVRAADGRNVRLGLLRQALQGVGTARLHGLGAGNGTEVGLNAREQSAADTSVLRAALVDTPWSAAFISYVVRNAGFSGDEFRFSEAHADYVDAAYATSTAEQRDGATALPYGWRACDIARTAPRPGDLICHTRDDSAAADTFDKLGAVLAERRNGQRRGGLAMHCDVVVAVDRPAAKLESIGGNVLQSVTLRRMDLNGVRPPALSAQYQASQRPASCARGAAGCADRRMNQQPWAVLLQYRK